MNSKIKSDILPYALQYNFKDTKPLSLDSFEWKKTQNDIYKSQNYQKPSKNLNDYFEITPNWTQKLEINGAENSLFLAIARSLLHKVIYNDSYYENILRNCTFSETDFIKDFKFDSDIALQELLRKKLCCYWLKNVKNSSFNNTKYNQ